MAFAYGYGKISIGRFSLLLSKLFKRKNKLEQTIGDEKVEKKEDTKKLNISFFGGKGGVGKTTCSTIFAYGLAQKGYKTLLVSTDPAHSLGDLLNVEVQSLQKIDINLWIKEIDSERAAKRYIEEVKQNLMKFTSPELLKEVERQLDIATTSPGADEAALFDELVTIILDAVDQYDHVVFDTAPTGHTLRLLSLPNLMEVWMEGMLTQRQKTTDMHRMLSHIAGVREDEPIDQVYHLLQRRKKRFSLVKQLLLQREQTTFYFVLNPERLPIIETMKAMEVLKKYHIHIGGVVVNRVLPKGVDGGFLAKRREQEQRYLKKMKEHFADVKTIYIPMQPTDIYGIEELKSYCSLFEPFIEFPKSFF